MELKSCARCKKTLPIKDFKNRSGKHSHLKQSYCTSCYNRRRYERRLKNQGVEEKKIIQRKKDLRRKYNLTIDEYNVMKDRQNECCAICGNKETSRYHSKLCVDHNHTTGKVRQLLCHACNKAIGLFNENPYNLQSAMNYLFLHNS